ncbi:unnamed protein product [Cuscuta epithymum]|nr:unnamed protein product [Cuscuta epithymum]
MRSKRPSVLLQDFVTNHVHELSPSSSSPDSSGFSGREPRSFREAMDDEKWLEAMQQEITALENNIT